jgi:predicted transcriptional regulator
MGKDKKRLKGKVDITDAVHLEIEQLAINGLSQAEIAAKLGFNMTALSKYMRTEGIQTKYISNLQRPITLYKIKDYTTELKTQMLAASSNNP